MRLKRQSLARRRKAVGFSQEALASVLDIERSTMVRWERGDTEPLPWDSVEAGIGATNIR